MITTHALLAGAYRGRRAKLDALLTHSSRDGGATSVCGKVADGNLCDEVVAAAPTCPACAS